MTTPRLAASVIVPTHQGAHRPPTLLDAPAAQDITDPGEVVVVVDAPTDDTQGVLNAFRERLPMLVLRSPAPRGVVEPSTGGTKPPPGASSSDVTTT